MSAMAEMSDEELRGMTAKFREESRRAHAG
jgi:hypothetical protein